MQEEVKHYKVKSLPTQLRPNSVYYVKATSQSAVKTYITDQNGFPFPLIDLTGGGNVGVIQSVTGTGVTGTFTNPIINIITFKSSDPGNLIEISSNDGKLFVKPITSPDGSIDIVSTSSALELQLGISLQTQIQNALQPGDNVSELTNDAGYLTQDNVVEYPNLASFPATGVIGTIYIALNTGFFYSWNGTTYIPSSAPSTGITGIGTTNYLSKFTSPTTIGNSRILDNGNYIYLNYTGRAPLNGNTFVSIQRNQSQIDFVLGNPGFSQPSYIISDNQTDGFEILSKGEFAIKTGSTYANEGVRVFSTGKLKFTQTPDTGTTSDYLLMRDTSGNVKQIAANTFLTQVGDLQSVTDIGNTTTNEIIVGTNFNDGLTLNQQYANIGLTDQTYAYQSGILYSNFYTNANEILTGNNYFAGLSALDGMFINTFGSSGYVQLKSDLVTTALRTIQFPDADGTLALTSDTTLQKVLDNNHSLVNDNNFQGTQAGYQNTGTQVNAFGNLSANNNSGVNVNAFGTQALAGNTANHVNGFGAELGLGNTYKNVNLFGYRAYADANNQNVFSKWVSGTTRYLGRLSFNNITTDRKWELPNASGTIALISDIPTVTTPTLQQVTNTGNTTTNQIVIGGGSSPGSTTMFLFNDIQINVLNNTGGYSNLAWLSPTNGLVLKTNPNLGYNSASLKSDLITGTDKVFQFPNTSGTLALTSDIPSSSTFVPYTGANASVNLGIYGISGLASSFSTASGNTSRFTSYELNDNIDATIGRIVLQGGEYLFYTSPTDVLMTTIYGELNLRGGDPVLPVFRNAKITYQTLTADRTYELPNASGTIALTSNTVASVGATSPITSSGGNTPTISTSMSTNKLIGRSTAGTGIMEEITVGTGLTLTGGTLNATAQPVGFEQNFLLMGA